MRLRTAGGGRIGWLMLPTHDARRVRGGGGAWQEKKVRARGSGLRKSSESVERGAVCGLLCVL